MSKTTGEPFIEERRKSRRTKPLHEPPPRPQVEIGIPIPPDGRGGNNSSSFDHFYPFERMKVGYSFWVAETKQNAMSAAVKFAAKTGRKFVSRAITKDGRKNGKVSNSSGLRGTRVWRIK